MNPLLDQLAVAALILGALAFFARRLLRRKRTACSTGCCTPKTPLVREDGSAPGIRRS